MLYVCQTCVLNSRMANEVQATKMYFLKVSMEFIKWIDGRERNKKVPNCEGSSWISLRWAFIKNGNNKIYWMSVFE